MKRCMLAGVSVLSALVLSHPATLLSQALERSMYVSVVDQAGAPVPSLGPSDFVVREDNLSREVLRVVPATDPMQIAILVDNSTAAGPLVAVHSTGAAGLCRGADAADRVRPAQRSRARHARQPADDPRQLFNRARAGDQGHRPRLGGYPEQRRTTSSTGSSRSRRDSRSANPRVR